MTKWLQILTTLISVSLLFFVDYNTKYSRNEYNVLKDQIELISWIFASVIAIISFFGLFIGFLHENKLVSASKILKEVYRPYTIGLEDIRQNLINYESSLSRNNLLWFIYFSFLCVSNLTIIVWGTSVGFYTKFQYSFNIQLTIEAFINVGIYVVFITIVILLNVVTWILNQILLFKDPLDKGYLPSPEEIVDINFLSKQKNDFDELMLKTAPTIEIYKNPPYENPSYEINLQFPIKWKNFKFALKLYGYDHESILKCYGFNSNVDFIGEEYITCLTDDFKEETFNLLDSTSYGELKIYTSENVLVSRLFLKIQMDYSNPSIRFVSSRSIKHRDKIDLDHSAITYLEKDVVKCEFFKR